MYLVRCLQLVYINKMSTCTCTCISAVPLREMQLESE